MQSAPLKEPPVKTPATGKPKNKRKRWRHWRHSAMHIVFYPAIALICRILYHIRVEKIKEKRQYLILFNHQTPIDQFIVEMAFPGSIYFLASEDIFSNGWISRLLAYFLAPIPINKSATDLKAVRICHQVAKEGGTIALAPEGNRTYSGVTENIKPSIVGLVRLLKLPVALLRLEGGYGVQPRWSDCIRGGRMRAIISGVIEPEEYASMSDEALYKKICSGLYVDETRLGGLFPSRHSAEYLERVIFYCPDCGFSTFFSKGEECRCLRCGKTVRYGADRQLRAASGDFPYATVKEWYDAQKDFISRLSPDTLGDEPLYEDSVSLYRVHLYRFKELTHANALLRLYKDRTELTVNGNIHTLLFTEITGMSILGRNKLGIQTAEKLWQIRGDKHFNAIKYMFLYYHNCNVRKSGEEFINQDEFLGL